jgi:metal-responsive CopG/Arc/MetJ family transcriptional regulator
MKTMISLDCSLMEQADAAGKELGLSRSALIAEALRVFLRERRRVAISEQLDRVYAQKPSRGERSLVRKFIAKMPISDRW